MTDSMVSVVIPTYYRNDLLQRAIESIRKQTHDSIEIIVVDGSGEAYAEPVANHHDTRYIAQDHDRGPHAARSEGAEAANGKYVNFLDDDDRFYSKKLEEQLSAIRSSESVGVGYCGIEWENGHPVYPNPDIRGDVLEYALRFRMTPSSPSTMLIDSSVLNEILPFRNLHGADDMGMKIELARMTEFEFIEEPLVMKGDAENSLGGSRENIEGRFELLGRYKDLYEQFPDDVYRDALGHTYLLDAEIRLNNQVWSASAIKSALLACYHVPGLPISFAGYFLASLLGRTGRDLGQRVYSRLFIGDEHRGKLT